ncbi:unnamed protein product [Spirodela intermedia]|uniref:Uncharacterized protein n=1 Tax=Spirodela intermedia TaxID=51605 RepID=A0A7I8KK67_SPIIN|nr:unnamed protein product [Spirodela intermedia]
MVRRRRRRAPPRRCPGSSARRSATSARRRPPPKAPSGRQRWRRGSGGAGRRIDEGGDAECRVAGHGAGSRDGLAGLGKLLAPRASGSEEDSQGGGPAADE